MAGSGGSGFRVRREGVSANGARLWGQQGSVQGERVREGRNPPWERGRSGERPQLLRQEEGDAPGETLRATQTGRV